MNPELELPVPPAPPPTRKPSAAKKPPKKKAAHEQPEPRDDDDVIQRPPRTPTPEPVNPSDPDDYWAPKPTPRPPLEKKAPLYNPSHWPEGVPVPPPRPTPQPPGEAADHMDPNDYWAPKPDPKERRSSSPFLHPRLARGHPNADLTPAEAWVEAREEPPELPASGMELDHREVATGRYFPGDAPGAGSAPSVTTLVPATAVSGGADFNVQIQGTGFVDGAAVQVAGPDSGFNDAAGGTFTWVSATEMTLLASASTGPEPGVYGVRVRNPDNQTSNRLDFTWTGPAPTLNSVEPDTAAIGGEVVMFSAHGSGFVSGATVQTNVTGDWANVASTVFINANQLDADATPPVGPGSCLVRVQNPDLQASAALPFTWTAPVGREGEGEPPDDGQKHQQRVRDRAYDIWVAEGKPQGRDQQIFERAEEEIKAERRQ